MIANLQPYPEYKESGLPTPKELCPPAQGCEERATLGARGFDLCQPRRGCGTGAGRMRGRNPVGVEVILRVLPKVAPRTAQPWAGGRNPVGILRRTPARRCNP